MTDFFWILAISGSAFLAVQTILILLGFGSDDDADVDSDVDTELDLDDSIELDTNDDTGEGAGVDDSVSSFQWFSLKSIVGFIGGAGWGGLIFSRFGLGDFIALAGGIGVGVVVGTGVAWLLYLLSKMKDSGTLQMRNALGQVGDVYLRIPAEESGTGKIQVVVQNSMRELNAKTRGEEIPTGARVRVTGIRGTTVIVSKIDTTITPLRDLLT